MKPAASMQLAGDGAASEPRRGSVVGAWALAIRPKTLAAGVVPVLVGTAIAFGTGAGRVLPALAALVGALLIQIGTNLTNDYYDYKKGADTTERVGPVRVTQAGLLSPKAVFVGAMASFAAAFVVGMYLVAVAGWPIVVVGLVSLLAGYAYTGGPFPLGYNGLGDVFVFVFFGLVAVAGTFFVQSLTLTPLAVAAGVPVGALATALLAVNNVRDARTDAKANKRTLVVRFGVPFGKAEWFVSVALAFATPVAVWVAGWTGPWVLVAFAAAPLTIPPARTLMTQTGAALNAGLAGTARLLLVFGALFSLGLYLGLR